MNMHSRMLFRFTTRIDLKLLRRRYASNFKESYDLLVVGGGSAGLSCAKEAATFSKKVAVLDFVDPSPHGSKWGLGGTCVNVGCIPKKLMHHAALLGSAMEDARDYGWILPEKSQIFHDWSKLCQSIKQYLRSLNWGYRVQLKDSKVDYLNAYGSFVDKNTIQIMTKGSKGKPETIVAKNILIASGGRPKYPDIPGAELGITSDDIFGLERPPGRTLVVGAGYVALECAGFLAGLGYPTSLMMRSVPLRGFDQEMAELALNSLRSSSVEILSNSVPLCVERPTNSDHLAVKFRQGSDERTLNFDTVLWAIGRSPRFEKMNLHNADLQVNENGKLIVDKLDRTPVDHIYALGDVQHGHPELTPVAIMAGKLLARRLFGGAEQLMDYDGVPTTVFTPLEYSTVGLSEERCLELFGRENIDVFHAFYKPLELAIVHRRNDEQQCHLKVICKRSSQLILGMHMIGPNSGEIMQGFAAFFRLKPTINDLQNTVGIHPTCAEEFVKIRITKRSGVNPIVTGC